MTAQAEDTVIESTDTEISPETEAVTSEDTSATPKVETRDGKLFVDGVRVYTRDDTNKIAANAKRQAEEGVLSTLEVDSIDTVKSVLSELRSTETEEGIDVKSLRDVVRKKSATVEELQQQVTQLKTQLVERDHLSKLTEQMPGSWTSTQREAVLDLMRARDMMAISDNQFVLRDGDNYFTQDGETPDYASAVNHVGKLLGLPFGKSGVTAVSGDKAPREGQSNKPVDQDLMSKDRAYRSAYVKLRSLNPGLAKNSITHNMVQEAITKYGLA